MKKKITTVVALILCAVLLVAGSVAATLAYLTSQTTVVTNTFTVGNIAITLDEAKVDIYGVEDEDADRVTANTYKLIPNQEYVKDPTVHIDANSETSYLYVVVKNNIAGALVDNCLEDQLTAKNWVAVDGYTDLYRYNTTVSGATGDVVVFESFTVKNGVDLASYAGKTIDIQAFAIQATDDVTLTIANGQAATTLGATPVAQD